MGLRAANVRHVELPPPGGRLKEKESEKMPKTAKKKWTGPRIRELRERLDMTQSELAAALRTDQSSVCRWEREHCVMCGPFRGEILDGLAESGGAADA